MGRKIKSAIKPFRKYIYQFRYKGGVLKIAHEITGVPWNAVC